MLMQDDVQFASAIDEAYEKGYADGSLAVTEEILAHKDKKIRAKGMLKGEKGCQQ